MYLKSHVFAFFILPLLLHVQCFPFPAGSIKIDSETIAVALPDPGDPAQAITNLTCAAIQSNAQGQSSNTRQSRREGAATRISRRAQSTTSFGAVIETVPVEAHASLDNFYMLTLKRGRSRPENHIKFSIFDDHTMSEHQIPSWHGLDGHVTDRTIQQIHAAYDDPRYAKPVDLRDFLFWRASTIYDEASHATRGAIVPDLNMRFNTRSMLDRGWEFVISPFDAIPGYSYTLGRRQAPVPQAMWTQISSNYKAIGVAICKVVQRAAWYMRWDLDLAHNAHATSLSTRDAMFIQVFLHVLTDLLKLAIDDITNARDDPLVDFDSAAKAVHFLGSGRVGDHLGHSSPIVTPFLDFGSFAEQAERSPMCPRHGGTGQIATS